uniref:ARAD1C19624p n=1 Tax=Blastobotrys adeninivorans TaxID=409370 RepID=A0A060T1W4_BLAAD
MSPLSQVDQLRLWRDDALAQHQNTTAQFIGDKILAMTRDGKDAYWLAQIYYSSGMYARARHLIHSHPGLESIPAAKCLAAQCLIKLGSWDEALDLLERGPSDSDDGEGSIQLNVGTSSGIKLEATMEYLKGQIYTNQNNFDQAKECYMNAVRIDIKCYQAFSQLIKNSLLSPSEEWRFLQSLDFKDAELTKALYLVGLSKYTNLASYKSAEALLSEQYGLGENSDVLLSRADMLFVQCRFRECLQLCETILEKDKYNFSILPNYLSCLHQTGSKNKLFLLAHELVDKHPQEAVSWLAVGSYYFTIGKIAEARRYFSKASMMNPYFGQAWIGFAHTFAVEGEHEQAISAYSTAARLFQGTHLPSLYLGMQHLQLSNLTIAEEYFSAAYGLCKTDPLLLNEMGVVHYHKNELKVAESYFHEALRVAAEIDSDLKSWHSIYINLAHVYRRMDEPDKALSYFERIIRSSASPEDASIYSAMGLVNLQAGRLIRAIECFHKALALTPNDAIASDLLNRALTEQSKAGVELLLGAEDDDDYLDGEEFPEIISTTPVRSTPKRLSPVSPAQFYDNDDSQMEMESD